MVDRARRLRREYEVRQARSHGRPFAAGPLVARIHPNPSHPETNRYAVVAGKKVGGAVERNRLKRLVREAIRHLDPIATPGHDIVIIVRGRTDEMPSLSVATESLVKIGRRAGIISSDSRRPNGSRPPSARSGSSRGDT